MLVMLALEILEVLEMFGDFCFTTIPVMILWFTTSVSSARWPVHDCSDWEGRDSISFLGPQKIQTMVLSTLDSRFDRVTLTYLLPSEVDDCESTVDWNLPLIEKWLFSVFQTHSKVHLGLRMAAIHLRHISNCGHQIVLT